MFSDRSRYVAFRRTSHACSLPNRIHARLSEDDRDGQRYLYFIDPGKPTQNAYIESFDGRFRDECLNTTIAIQHVASVFAHDGNPERAARLLGYVDAWYRLRERLSDETFARSVLAGSRIDENEEIADAIVRPRIPYARDCARGSRP